VVGRVSQPATVNSPWTPHWNFQRLLQADWLVSARVLEAISAGDVDQSMFLTVKA
jgi:hypothetical protein